eukprot:scaffold2777_cov302-Alexandrium_tamarense.AAC.2
MAAASSIGCKYEDSLEAAFLQPPQQVVQQLLDKLTQLRVGIVVDVELQEEFKLYHNDRPPQYTNCTTT